MQKVLLVAGARPNFVKIAPLWRALAGCSGVRVMVVHTGQHYDRAMDAVFFEDLGLPAPDFNLQVGRGTHAVQTGLVMQRFDAVVAQEKPDDVMVVGDVNSTLACALVAAKRGIRLSHVEAGLRSFDPAMPEEINRKLTDAVSDWLFVSEPSGIRNLKMENIPEEKIRLVGNVMIDSLLFARHKIDASKILAKLGLEEKAYGVVTLHRPSNVDTPERLQALMSWLRQISGQVSLVFPVHPRTRQKMEENQLFPATEQYGSGPLHIISPQPYIDFQKLVKSAQFVITDSGGIQEETTWLGIPCITLRNNTERPVTVDEGTNYLVGENLTEASRVINNIMGKASFRKTADSKSRKTGKIPDLWDGHTAERIVKVLLDG